MTFTIRLANDDIRNIANLLAEIDPRISKKFYELFEHELSVDYNHVQFAVTNCDSISIDVSPELFSYLTSKVFDAIPIFKTLYRTVLSPMKNEMKNFIWERPILMQDGFVVDSFHHQHDNNTSEEEESDFDYGDEEYDD